MCFILPKSNCQQEGCIVCPSTDTTFDLKTGAVRDWMPSNPVLKFLTPPLRDLLTYPVKIEGDSIYINVKGRKTGESAEIVFGGITQAGKTATNVDVDEVWTGPSLFCTCLAFTFKRQDLKRKISISTYDKAYCS